MSKLIMAQENGRIMGGPDKIFGFSTLAKKRIAEIGKENVVNSTIGALLDDNGNLIVLSSVIDVLKNLSPTDYAEYAPIAGTPEYLTTVKKAVFGNYQPKGYVEACATPGGTGAIRNAIQNYTKRGDIILTSDWHWSPYNIITTEMERKLNTYTLFDENQNFNYSSLDQKLNEILKIQDETVIIINTPAHNPTGYTFTLEDWDKVNEILKKAAEDKTKKITLLVDIAYLDFSGDADEYREFFSKLEDFPDNVLVLIAFSTSKGYTLYGMRCGALLCLTPNKDIAEEFKMVASFSSRGSWSNGTRASMVVLSQIFANKNLLAKVTEERHKYLAILTKRGNAFMKAAKECNLKTCPFDSGFFITIPCKNADQVGEELQKSNIFAVPIGAGIRISIASISEEACKMIPAKIAEAISNVK